MRNDKIKKVVEKGKKYIKPNREIAWENLCYSLCRSNGLGEVGLETISEAIETMRLFEEEDLSTEDAIKRVGGGWSGGISSCLLEMIITSFSKRETFCEDWENIKKDSKRSITFDDLLAKNSKDRCGIVEKVDFVLLFFI